MSNSRLSREDMLMAMAKVISRRGTCSRLQVGAVFSREGRIISTGYNGAPAGLPHCDHTCTCKPYYGQHTVGCPTTKPCLQAEHAEKNGVAFAARYGSRLEGCEAHLTHSPCLSCAMTLVNAGVVRVVYFAQYRDVSGLELLEQAGIEVVAYQALEGVEY